MTEINTAGSDRTLLRLLPGVLRARDFHLYLEGGQRLTDLWLQGGRAILGHKPAKVLGELKNAAERGLFGSFPHPQEARFIKALGQFFPGRAFRLYQDMSSLYLALEKAGFKELAAAPLSDPAFPQHTPRQIIGVQGAEKPLISLWRPFIEIEADISRLTTFWIPVLPWPLGPVVLVLDKNMEPLFPQGELISPVLLAPATRAMYDLAAKTCPPDFRRYPKLEKALKGGFWKRRGIYITMEPSTNMEEYAVLFRRFLDGGFLIPPSPVEPVILPAEMSQGEESKLAALFKLQ